LEEAFEKQAVIINNAFQEQTDHFDRKFEGIDKRFDKIEDRLTHRPRLPLADFAPPKYGRELDRNQLLYA
jgi:hypothetical protein